MTDYGFNIEILHDSKIMVVGCGSLGNEVLKNLALIGVGNLFIVDFDKIEPHNLNRSILFSLAKDSIGKPKVEIASKMIKSINPGINVVSVDGDFIYDVGLGLIGEMDVVISCVDNRWTRFIINRYCMAMGISWVEGGISGLEGSVKVFSPEKGCYACLIGDKIKADMTRRFSCPGIIRRAITNRYAPTNPLSASIIGSMQVQEALKIISNKKSERVDYSILEGKMFSFDGKNLTWSVSSFDAWDDICCEHEPLLEIKDCGLKTSDTIRESLEKIKSYFKVSTAEFFLDRDTFVTEIFDINDEKIFPVMKPSHQIESFLAIHPALSDFPLGKLRMIEWRKFDESFSRQNLTLKEFGIPPKDILRVIAEKKEYHIFVE